MIEVLPARRFLALHWGEEGVPSRKVVRSGVIIERDSAK